MKLHDTKIPGVMLIEPSRIGDARGYFSEVFKNDWFRENVSRVEFVQDNESYSALKYTVRGLHFQLDPFAQGKLVRCVSGGLFDVAVDIRKESPTFGEWVGAQLTPHNGMQLWIPPGFAHGFMTTEPDTVISYKVTATYSAAHDRGMRWDDPAVGIEWPLQDVSPILSDKDKVQPYLAELSTSFVYHN